MTNQKFEWKCPRLECKYSVTAWTERGLDEWAAMHREEHNKQDREQTENITTAMVLFRTDDYYNTLRMSTEDIAFLRSRHIKIDEQIQYDPSIEYKPVDEKEAYNRLPRSKWMKILDKLWNK